MVLAASAGFDQVHRNFHNRCVNALPAPWDDHYVLRAVCLANDAEFEAIIDGGVRSVRLAQKEVSRLVMYFDSVADALAMSGHGVFVWGAYSISFVIIFFVLLRPVMSIRTLNAGIRQEAQRKQSAQVAQRNAS